MNQSKKVQGQGMTYRAFAIDTASGESSALLEMEEKLARLELEQGDSSDGDVNELEEVAEIDDAYEDCGIGNAHIFAVDNEFDRRTMNNVCLETRDGRKSIFYVNFRMQNLENEIESYRVLLDTGATVNVVPESFIEILMHGCSSNVQVADCAVSEAKVASGGKITFEPYEAEFQIVFSERFKLKFENSKVYKGPSKTIILGWQGFIANKIEIKPHQKTLEIMIGGPKLNKLWNNFCEKPINRNAEILLTEDPVERTSTIEPHFYSSDVINQNATSKYDPDGTRAWYRKLERLHAESRVKNRLKDILLKYKVLFEGTVG